MTAETVPLLGRITGILFPPGATSPLDGVACLVHPRIAVVPGRAIDPGMGDRFTLRIGIGERVWDTGVSLVGNDRQIAAMILDEAPPYDLPETILAAPRARISGGIETILAQQEPPYLLLPIKLTFSSVGPTQRGFSLQHLDFQIPPDLKASPVVGAPLVQGRRVLGILDEWDAKQWHALTGRMIHLSAAFNAALQRLTKEVPAESAGSSANVEPPLKKAHASRKDQQVEKTQEIGGSAEAEVVQQAVSQAAETAPFSYFDAYDEEAQAAIAHADGMRRRAGFQQVRMEHLVAALAAFPGDTQKVLHRVAPGAENLRSILGELSGVPIPTEYEARALDAVPPNSARVGTALVAARAAAAAEGAEKVTAWHLLSGAATVADSPVIQKLEELGLRGAMDDLRRGALVEQAPLAGGQPGEAVGGVRYAADTPEGGPEDEKLGIGREVRALATLLAAKETPLPLSLGLFGDWGSGKSFFMHQLELEIAKRSAEGKASGSAYCGGIVQIKFNAWHYIDTNLWASLAAAIFQALAATLDADGDEDDARERAALKGRLLAQTAHLQQVRDDAQEKKRRLDRELRAEEGRLERLQAEERSVRRSLTAGELARAAWRMVAERADVKDAVADAAEKLGVSPAKVAVAETRAQLMEMGRIRQSLWGLREALAERSPWRRYVVVLGIALGLAGVILLLDSGFGLGIFRRIDRLPGLDALRSGIALLTAGLVTGTAALRPLVGAVKSAVGVLEEAKAKNRERVEEERKRAREALLTRQAAITQDRADTEEQIAATNRDLQALERRIAELHPERRLQSFVEERGASTEYTRHLGVIASARRDFEKLSDRLDEVVKEARAAAESTDSRPPIIDRIVLYIDDLDRCPENKVVEVLQAVHLLLAFDLFVVVVGVDSRWLLHSLRSHSAAFRARRDDDEDGVSEEERVHWQSTPMNYLEKIFQIPFTLRPMGRTGFGDLIDHLAAPRPGAVPPAAVPEAALVAQPVGEGAAETDAERPAGTPSTGDSELVYESGADSDEAEPGLGGLDAGHEVRRAQAEAAAALAERLAIREGERAFMKEMHPLIPTPRAAKRFLNVYRLIRGSLDGGRFEALTGDAGQYRAVLLLLALLTGYPAEATVVLRDLVETRPDGSWPDYLDDLDRRCRADAARAPRPADAPPEANGAGNGGPPDAADPVEHPFGGLEGIDPARWEEMLERVRLVPLPPEQTCADFVEWAPEVGRYSFYSGRVLLGRSAAEEPAAA